MNGSSMCCPDQSSYELADRASLLDGNRTRGGLRPSRTPGTRDGGQFRPGRIYSLLYVMRAAMRNRKTARAGQFMAAVFQAGAIATCAPGRPSVNCPNKKC